MCIRDRCDIQSIIHFVNARKVCPVEIHRELREIYKIIVWVKQGQENGVSCSVKED